jgi:hypothetical protein
LLACFFLFIPSLAKLLDTCFVRLPDGLLVVLVVVVVVVVAIVAVVNPGFESDCWRECVAGQSVGWFGVVPMFTALREVVSKV